MSVISNLTVRLSADTVEFDNVMRNATRGLQNLRQAGVDVFNATRTPTERYQKSLQTLGALYRTGQIDVDTYGRATRQLMQEFKEASTATGKAGIGFQQFASGVLGFAGPAGAAIAITNRLVDGFERLAAASVGAVVKGVQLAASFEKAHITFTTLYKSASTATEVLNELKQFAALTPFEFPELKDAAVKLAGFGISAKQIAPTIKLLGELAAGTGQNIGELAETYGKARIQGRAYTRDINELTNRGIPIWEALKKQQHASTDEIHAMVEAGKIGFPEIQSALISLVSAGGQFEGGLQRQSQGLEGLYSTLKDNVTLSLAGIGEAIVKEFDLKNALRDMIEFTNTVQNQWVPEIAAAIGAFKELNDVVGIFKVPPIIKDFVNFLTLARRGVVSLEAAWAHFTGDVVLEQEALRKLMEMALPSAPAGAGPGLPDVEQTDKKTSAEELADSIAKLNAELQKEIDTFGLSHDQVKIWELAQQGATQEQLAAAQAAQQHVQALKDQKKAFEEGERAAKRHQEEGERLIEHLQQEIDKLSFEAAGIDAASDAARVWAYEQKNGLDVAAQMAEVMLQQVEALKQQKEAFKEAAKEEKYYADLARRITEEVQSPLEKYAEQKKVLEDMFAAGLIDEETAQRKFHKLGDEFLEATGGKGDAHSSENKALLAGTAEAFSAVNRANDPQKTTNKILNDALTIQRRQELIQIRTENALQGTKVWTP